MKNIWDILWIPVLLFVVLTQIFILAKCCEPMDKKCNKEKKCKDKNCHKEELETKIEEVIENGAGELQKSTV